MAKRSRLKYVFAEQRGTAYSVSADTTLTTANINSDGYSFIKISGAFTLTLPAAEDVLKGTRLIVFGDNANSKVAVVAGFGGGGGSYDTVTIGAYCAIRFWCDGSQWYALSESVSAS